MAQQTCEPVLAVHSGTNSANEEPGYPILTTTGLSECLRSDPGDDPAAPTEPARYFLTPKTGVPTKTLRDGVDKDNPPFRGVYFETVEHGRDALTCADEADDPLSQQPHSGSPHATRDEVL